MKSGISTFKIWVFFQNLGFDEFMYTFLFCWQLFFEALSLRFPKDQATSATSVAVIQGYTPRDGLTSVLLIKVSILECVHNINVYFLRFTQKKLFCDTAHSTQRTTETDPFGGGAPRLKKNTSEIWDFDTFFC